jgi:hypothetical protein
MAGRACTICTHARVREIDRAIIAGNLSIRAIACQFSLNRESIRRHRAEHLVEKLRDAYVTAPVDDKYVLADLLNGCFRRVNKLLDAADEALTDPDNPEKYTLDPRANEVFVIYDELEDNESGKPKYKRKRDSMDTMIRRIEGELPGLIVKRVKAKCADPRTLILDACRTLDKPLQMLGEFSGNLERNQKLRLEAAISARLYLSHLSLVTRQLAEKMGVRYDAEMVKQAIEEAFKDRPDLLPILQEELASIH